MNGGWIDLQVNGYAGVDFNAPGVKFRRQGKVVYYSLNDEHVKHIFDEGLRHITE